MTSKKDSTKDSSNVDLTKAHDLKSLFKDHVPGHSVFQDDYLITVRAGGTHYGQYKQALRELHSRFHSIRDSLFDREKALIDLEEQEWLAENADNQFDRRRAALEYKRRLVQFEDLEQSIKDTEKEFRRFYQQASYLRNLLGPLDEKKTDELDREMWIYKAKELAAIDFVSQGRMGNNTYEFINAMPKEMRDFVLEEVKDHSKLIEWYETKDEHYVINFDQLPKIEMKKKDIKALLSDTLFDDEITEKLADKKSR